MCQDDEACETAAVSGVCEASGFCSFPDEACESGRRYGEWAEDGLSGTCVGASEPGSTGPSSSTTAQPGPTTAHAGEETTSNDATSDGTAGERVCPEDWWDCAWTRRQALTLQAMPLAEPLQALPIPLRPGVLLSRDPSLTVVDGSGTPLPWEREGDVLWVAVDVEPDTALALWVYAGNPDPPPPQTMPVWDTSYVAVWHLPGGEDASGSGNLAVATEVVEVDGVFGLAASFDGVDDRFDLAASDTLADLRAPGFTIEAWILPDPDSTAGYRRILDKADDPDSTLGWSLMVLGDAPLHQLEINYGYDTGERQSLTAAFEVADWVHLVVVTHPGDDAEFWLDGTPLAAEVTTPGLGRVPSDALQPATLGAPTTSTTATRFFDGGLDEIRISRGVRSPSWVTGTYTAGQPEAVVVGQVEVLE